ncbi:hypothetical protein FISHEDRAFT_55763 [Fistulina hepatica ATCC 64428]|uniref:Uncharacterized protein n=1 Tax=Fistulina hepatica ATCC 64428 TaxID=1128425 RepID=A0A0D7AML1_9AGAR|nr:hypothetical protein FISHEDRAFT_55763 [Fistulina hepatica ATCC 64428]
MCALALTMTETMNKASFENSQSCRDQSRTTVLMELTGVRFAWMQTTSPAKPVKFLSFRSAVTSTDLDMGANDNTLGALLVGVIISCLFLGASIVQRAVEVLFAQLYTVVIALLCNIGPFFALQDVGQTADKLCSSPDRHNRQKICPVYVVMVIHYGDYAILDDIGWGLLVITAVTVQLFYIHRIYMRELLGRKLILPVILDIHILNARFYNAWSIVYAIKCSTIPTSEIPKLTNLVTGVNGTAAGLDIVIAAIILFMLLSYRTGMRRVAAIGTFLALYLSPDTYICYIRIPGSRPHNENIAVDVRVETEHQVDFIYSTPPTNSDTKSSDPTYKV